MSLRILQQLDITSTGTHLTAIKFQLLWSSIQTWMNCNLCELIPTTLNRKYQLPSYVSELVVNNFTKDECVKLCLWYSLTYPEHPKIDVKLLDRRVYRPFFNQLEEPTFTAITELNRLLDNQQYQAFQSVKHAEKMLECSEISHCTFLAICQHDLSKTRKIHRRYSKLCEVLEGLDSILTTEKRDKINDIISTIKRKTKGSISSTSIGRSQ